HDGRGRDQCRGASWFREGGSRGEPAVPPVQKRTSGPVLPRRERPLGSNSNPEPGQVKRTAIRKAATCVHQLGTWIVIGCPARAESISAAFPSVIATAMFS